MVGGDQGEIEDFCGQVTQEAVIEDRRLVPEERRVAIHICREPMTTLQEAWTRLR